MSMFAFSLFACLGVGPVFLNDNSFQSGRVGLVLYIRVFLFEGWACDNQVQELNLAVPTRQHIY